MLGFARKLATIGKPVAYFKFCMFSEAVVSSPLLLRVDCLYYEFTLAKIQKDYQNITKYIPYLLGVLINTPRSDGSLGELIEFKESYSQLTY